MGQLFAVLPHRYDGGGDTFEPFKRFIEPFYGSGTVAAQAIDRGLAQRYLLGDRSADLVACHLAARDDADQLIASAIALRDATPATREGFEAVRDGKIPATRAARFLYIVAASFNGLWRTNSEGVVNTGYGHRFLLDEDAIRAQGARLRRPDVALVCADFAALVRGAGVGDLVYCDPPYVDNFSGYVRGGFDRATHLRLARCLRAAARRGAKCFVSNSATPMARAIYTGRVHDLIAMRSMSRDGNTRGDVAEILVEVTP